MKFLMVAALAVLLLPAAAQAAPVEWAPGDHPLGRSQLSPANVAKRGSTFRLNLPAGTTDGAEIRSAQQYASGVVRSRIRVANAPSSLTGFFLYAAPDYASEIDIEIMNDRTGTVLFSTYSGGSQTHTETTNLGFDPTAAAHTYEIAWGAGRVQFTVDGVVRRVWTDGVPTAPMNLYANAWFPKWLDGLAPAGTRTTVIDRIEYRRR
ncbi:glycoside hydrolase family 16 protein [Solirubrobacter sp. CPCC 204708]|uniref:Beta-glucanase n=1 Tax=Solirubrobacter deserti TaxID=2282478 RepID=A0ABT4RQK0_9ACTN|nr:glycoside hydrolase family 16 protein [Solirubrobacter deserti]MBE2319344.1 glycoside hydrolase family 16 protein [Solirubrobacter deserti]MDA0140842.1 glycoside hydrolase family 16 protein [Solirubrobacter deserti]